MLNSLLLKKAFSLTPFVSGSHLILHPFLLAIYPPFFLYSQNVHTLPLDQIIFISFLFTLASLIVWCGLGFLLKNKIKAGLLTSLMLAWIFFYKFVFELGKGLIIKDLSIWRHKYVFSFWSLLFVIAIIAIGRRRSSFLQISRVLNVFSLSLSLFCVSWIGVQVAKSRPPDAGVRMERESLQFHETDRRVSSKSGERPDIYYIVLDAYARFDILKAYYRFDNSPFYDFLRRKGFYVALRSHSNFDTTRFSLASSLNMEFVHDLVKDSAQIDRLPLYSDLIKNNKLAAFLRGQRYRFICLGFYNEYADLNIVSGDARTKTSVDVLPHNLSKPLLEKSILSMTFLDYFSQLADIAGGSAYREGILHDFNKLQEIRDVEGPKFVFAHILSPHPPFAFGPDGEKNSLLDALKMGPHQLYVRQLVYINTKVMNLLDVLLAPSANPPIIILQSDHGQRIGMPGDSVFNHRTLEERFGILNACYVPHLDTSAFYDSMSPINTIRLVLNAAFQANFPLVKDDSFIYLKGRFVNVTDQLALR